MKDLFHDEWDSLFENIKNVCEFYRQFQNKEDLKIDYVDDSLYIMMTPYTDKILRRYNDDYPYYLRSDECKAYVDVYDNDSPVNYRVNKQDESVILENNYLYIINNYGVIRTSYVGADGSSALKISLDQLEAVTEQENELELGLEIDKKVVLI